MGQPCTPRSGSMQYWPRKRAIRIYPSIGSWASPKECKLLGFAGYKAAMTQVTIMDSAPNSMTKGMEVPIPVTIIECPPLKAYSVRLYKKTNAGLKSVCEIRAEKADKELSRRISMPKKAPATEVKPFDEARLIVYTQPKLTGIGQKRPEMFELAISGSKEDQLKLGQSLLGKEIAVTDVFKPGAFIDAHAVSKGKGYQGPVKRFGIDLRSHKSEKTKRGPGSLGAWQAQGHIMYRVAHAGQMGYHTRTDYNKQIIKVMQPQNLNPKGGFKHYSNLRNASIIVKGSIPGPSKRLIIFIDSIRPDTRIKTSEPIVNYVKA